MTKYIDEVARLANLLSELEIHQFNSYASTLTTIEPIQIFILEILPQIEDLDRRRKLKKILMGREQELYARATQDVLISQALQENKSISLSDQLSLLWQNIKQHTDAMTLERPKPVIEVPAEVKREQPGVVFRFFSFISDGLKRFFGQDEAIKNLSSAVPSKPTRDKEPYHVKLSKEDRDTLAALRAKGAQRVAQVTGLTAVGEAKARTSDRVESSMTSRFGMVLASQMVSATQNDYHNPLFKVIESLAQKKDNHATIEKVSDAINQVLDGSQSTLLNKEHTFSTGGNPAVVTALESDVIEKLVNSPEDYQQYGLNLSQEERAQIHVYHDNMKQSKDLVHVLSQVRSSWGGYEPRYKPKDDPKKDSPHGYKKVDVDSDSKQQAFEATLAISSKLLQESCNNLADGQSLYLETGLEEHAMQLVIKREGCTFKLSTYDSSGALENTSQLKGGVSGITGASTGVGLLINQIGGVIQLAQLNKGAMRKNALTFSVPAGRLNSKEGLTYLSYLIETNSMAGWAKTHIELAVQHTTMEERSHMGYFENLTALRARSEVYSNYIKKFSSLASPDAPPQFSELLQRPQNTSNCYAKKTQSCELYELGKSTYKKVRLAMLLEQRKGLLDDICGKGEEPGFIHENYSRMLKNIEPMFLSPSELHERSMRLCEIKTIPSKDYYLKFFNALLDARGKLAKNNTADNQLAIKRIDDKISSHARSFYLYLKQDHRQRDIEAIFSPEVFKKNPPFDWSLGVMPLKTDANGTIEPRALERLSEHATALAWKASIELINHQIKKLSVNERFIHSASERLSHASERSARTVTLQDLAEANVISFTSGFSRTEEIKIELTIGGTRKEIDKATFFKLVVAQKEALTHPKIIGLLDFLRNADPAIEKRYAKEVYPAQRKAFVTKLEKTIEIAGKALNSSITRLRDHDVTLNGMVRTSQSNIDVIREDITKEQQAIGVGKKSVKLKNLESRLELLSTERNELERLQTSLQMKIQNLQQNSSVEGSSNNQIAKANDILLWLKTKDPNSQSINDVSQAYTTASVQLSSLHDHVATTINTFEVDDVEKEAHDRVLQIQTYRRDVIHHHLETNAAYRVIDELSAGRMGTEKDRNRSMYTQSAEERANFSKQERNTFLEGSVFQDIQRLNQTLKAKIAEVVERKVIICSNTHGASGLASIASANDEYITLDQHAREFSQQPIPEKIKKEWVEGMFALWLKHENPERLHLLQTKTGDDLSTATHQAFYHFLEQKANMNYATLKGSGYPLDLSVSQMQTIGGDRDIEVFRDKRKTSAKLIATQFKAFKRLAQAKPQDKRPSVSPIQLMANDIAIAPQQVALASNDFLPSPMAFLLLQENTAVAGSSLRFLRENPQPHPQGNTKEKSDDYHRDVAYYLQQLTLQPGLENRNQRITEFCFASAATLFKSPFSPPPQLAAEIIKSMLSIHRSEEGTLNKSFMTLENTQRNQLLTSLIKLSLLQLADNKVNYKFLSIIKQWEKLIVPHDEVMAQQISLLSPDGMAPEDMTLLTDIDIALHESPVSLEGLYEGQQGLQIALTAFGNEKGVDGKLRKLADRLSMRHGDALLAHQFIDYYSNPNRLLSMDGLNSTQGRELFERALFDAFQQAKEDDKHALLNFLKALRFIDKEDSCTLKTPHQIFIDEVLIKCDMMDTKVFQANTQHATDSLPATAVNAFIDSLTDTNNNDGADRLFGFAKEVNLLALHIEHAQHQIPIDQPRLDHLYAQLICSKLAYQLILDQASEETVSNLKQNFEYTREMASAQSNINTLQETLVQFSRMLHENERSETFARVFSQYAEEKKFDGPRVNITEKPAPIPDLPGFISLGSNKTLDILHGVVYLGHHKLGGMPAYIQDNIALKELGIDHLPFKLNQGGFIYVEGDAIKASITPQKDGTLIIQRALKTLAGDTQMLQYIQPDRMDSIPIALKRRLQIEHFFFDSTGSIHGFSKDFTPILKLSNDHGLWSGKLLDHARREIPIRIIDAEASPMVKELSKLFPADEMITVHNNTIYIPSIAKYVIHNDITDDYVMSDGLTDMSSRRQLKLTKEGIAYTEKELSAAETAEVGHLTKKITDLQQELHLLKASDILGKQAKNKIERTIEAHEAKIKEITSPDYFVFIGTSPQIITLERELSNLRQAMQKAYTEVNVGKKDKQTPTADLEKTKEDYLNVKASLDAAYASADCLRTYASHNILLNTEKAGEPSRIKAKDFQSILHVGTLPGKTRMLIQLLGANLPQSPLKSGELDALRYLKVTYQEKQTMEDRLARILLIGTEIQHHILAREACATAKLDTWERDAYSRLLEEFAAEVNEVDHLFGKLPLDDFSELWKAIQSEFENEQLRSLFAPPVTPIVMGQTVPININTRITDMPIEKMGCRAFILFKPHDSPHVHLDKEQVDLEQRLQHLDEFRESVQAQEDGYYYETYGFFNAVTLGKLLSISTTHPGIGGLTNDHVSALFELMKKEGWIRPVEGTNKFQATRHPSEFYSSAKIAGYLTEQGFGRSDTRAISDRLETFFYQTMVNGGTYSIKASDKGELLQKLTEEQAKDNEEYLQALDKIESIMAKSSSQLTFADLNTAYLLNDYSRVLSHYPAELHAHIALSLNNSLTRLLYYKTELDHLNDVQTAFAMGQDAKALSMLHSKRNYPLDKLLSHESSVDKTPMDMTLMEQEQKMQRAFLLFESEFGHRCNSHQVTIFRGLLLDDDMHPDKINSAQARMGFGKTTLLPLVALYKTGEKLVRFIVPKSALESNTSDISSTLSHLIGGRAIKDDFHRYRIEADPQPDMGSNSPRLKSLQDAKADLKKRLSLYRKTKDNLDVLVQAPSVRSALECQSKIFLDLLLKLDPKETMQRKELMGCISLLNKIRSLTTVSIFDELDATQDSATTDVNYTAGEKIPFNSAEIYPLELITQTIRGAEDRAPDHLAKALLKKFNMADPDNSLFDYVRSLKVKQPASVTASNSTSVYLMRAILSDPVMLNLITDKEPGTDFGVWFQKAPDGSTVYDTEQRTESRKPLLIAVPYSAANTPKPQGSRFDNPEVAAITTFLYYLDPRTDIHQVPHLEFLIDSFRQGIGDKPFLDPTGQGIGPDFVTLLEDIKKLADIEDPIFRNAEREKYFAELDKGSVEKKTAFRKILARTIIQEQITSDAGKANSNRYEQGTTDDVVIGFSGTAGDTSSYFKTSQLDPGADGNLTLGLMGRQTCQATIGLDTTRLTEADEGYTSALIKQLAQSFSDNTRALIDAGGLCKLSNQDVAKEIAMALKNQDKLRDLKGVIFYDDVTNMKKLLVIGVDNQATILDFTAEMMTDSDQNGHYFTYYDQSHSRGADIKQMDNAHAVLTLNFTVTNNDYKQAIMRMRKMIDKSLGQSFSTAVPDLVKEKIMVDLKLASPHQLTGNDIAFWLRQKELKQDLNTVSVFMMELDSIVKNAILQQQAEITQLMSVADLTDDQINLFSQCIQELNVISPFISGSVTDLQAKYGGVYGEVNKEDFINDLKKSFNERMTAIFAIINQTRMALERDPIPPEDKKAYFSMQDRIIQRREAQLGDTFMLPSASNALAEAHSETESQSHSQSQSQSQTQTHSFSEVTSEEVVVDVQLRKHDILLQPVSIEFLSVPDAINALPFAYEMPSMQNLFETDDPIRCSPSYQSRKESEEPVPPVRYFIARNEGDPKIILMNQDEADLFKASPVGDWSLYDLRLNTADTLVPLAGPHSPTLKDDRLLKKLNFAAFRYQVTGGNLASLATSLDGLCTPDQLQPSLSILVEQSENVSDKRAVFNLHKWGFHGEKQRDIPLTIEQTQKKFKDALFEKRGVTLSVGAGESRAEVFISSKLNHRLLTEASAEPPKLKTVIAHVAKDYQAAMDERADLKTGLHGLKDNLTAIKAAKKKVMNDYDKKIADLDRKKAEIVAKGKQQLAENFPKAMNVFLNQRQKIEEDLENNLRVLLQVQGPDSQDFGFPAFGKIASDLDAAVADRYNELYKRHEADLPLMMLNNEELLEFFERDLFASIHNIQQPVQERLNCYLPAYGKHKTIMDALWDASKEPAHMHGEQGDVVNEDVKLWGNSLDDALTNYFFDYHQKWIWMKQDDVKNPGTVWSDFCALIKKEIMSGREQNLTLEVFQGKLLAQVKQFASDNELDVDKVMDGIKYRLCFSFEFASDYLRQTAITEVIRNIVKRAFIEALKTPKEEQMDFYSLISRFFTREFNWNEQRPNPFRQIILPPSLLDFNKDPLSPPEITEAINQVLAAQNVQTTKPERDRLTQDVIAYLRGQKEILNLLEHYRPEANRSLNLEPVDGQERKLFTQSYELLVDMDHDVLDIQKQIDEAQAQRKDELETLEGKQAELRVKLEANHEKLKELKGEVSATNKLISGTQKLLRIFSDQQVVVEEVDPADFIDAHFDLPKIIGDKMAASATLSFIPPKFYDVQRDLAMQCEHLHGLEEETIEVRAQVSLDEANTIVREAAGDVQARECTLLEPHAEQALEEILSSKVEIANVELDVPRDEVNVSDKSIEPQKLADKQHGTQEFKVRFHVVTNDPEQDYPLGSPNNGPTRV